MLDALAFFIARHASYHSLQIIFLIEDLQARFTCCDRELERLV